MSFSFSYNLDLDLTEPEENRPDDLYAVDAVELYPLADGQQLAVNTKTRQRAIIPHNVAQLLRLCQRFRTLNEHCEAVLGALPGQNTPPADTIMGVLEDLRAGGLLVNGEQWLARFQTSAEPPPALNHWVLVITTCDRPALLQRLLDSLRPCITETVRPKQVLLIDDSRRQSHRQANRRHWAQWLAACNLFGEYWDRDARARLCRMLAQDVEDADTLDWMLSPETVPDDRASYGQTKNLALLLTAGQRVLLVDDDCLMEPFRHAFCKSKLRMGDVPIETFPYPDRASLMADVQRIELNPLAEHLHLLGSTPPLSFEQLGFSWSDGAWLRDLDELTRKRLSSDSAVRLTVNATLGDPGTPDMTWLYARSAESNARLAACLRDVPEGGDLERLLWKGRSSHLLTFDETLMTTTLTGIDNRVLSVCMLPFGRGEDRLLGDGLRALHPQALYLAFNWGLPHDPEPVRHWQRSIAAGTSLPGPDWFLQRFMSEAGNGYGDGGPEQRLRRLADDQKTLAALTDDALAQRLEKLFLDARSRRLGNCLKCRAESGSLAGNWQHDLDRLIERTYREISQSLRFDEGWLAEFRALSRRFADALEDWPGLRDRVSRRRAEFGRIAGPTA